MRVLASLSWLMGVVIFHKIPGKLYIRTYLVLIGLICLSQAIEEYKDSKKPNIDLVHKGIIEEGLILDLDESSKGPSNSPSTKTPVIEFIEKAMSPRKKNNLYVPPFSEQGKKV